MLACKKEVMMFMQKRSVKSNESLPLLVVQLRLRARICLGKRSLFIVDLRRGGISDYSILLALGKVAYCLCRILRLLSLQNGYLL